MLRVASAEAEDEKGRQMRYSYNYSHINVVLPRFPQASPFDVTPLAQNLQSAFLSPVVSLLAEVLKIFKQRG